MGVAGPDQVKPERLESLKKIYVKTKLLQDEMVKGGEGNTFTALYTARVLMLLDDAIYEAKLEIKNNYQI